MFDCIILDFRVVKKTNEDNYQYNLITIDWRCTAISKFNKRKIWTGRKIFVLLTFFRSDLIRRFDQTMFYNYARSQSPPGLSTSLDPDWFSRAVARAFHKYIEFSRHVEMNWVQNIMSIVFRSGLYIFVYTLTCPVVGAVTGSKRRNLAA